MEIACAVLERDGAVLVARRPGRGLFAGLWALPGDAVSRGEPPAQAVRRALRGLGLAGQVGGELAAVERTLTHRDLTLRAFRCSARGGLRPGGDARLRWVPWAEVNRLGMATAMRRLAEAIAPHPAPSRVGRGGIGSGRGELGRTPSQPAAPAPPRVVTARPGPDPE